jgi:hypothetical protein
MKKRWFVAAAVVALAGTPGHLTQALADTAFEQARLSDAEAEHFLLEARIMRRKGAPGGITGSERATLRLGDMQHDAHIQRIDDHRHQFQTGTGLELDFRDSFRGNLAAYRLDRMLGLAMVPVTVRRRVDGRDAAVTWWVDDVIMDEKKRYQKKIPAPDPNDWNQQMLVVRVFDQLIHNFDRNLGNLLIDREWRIWMIDHTRAFKIFGELRAPENLGTRCERGLLAGLRRLDEATLRDEMRDLMNEGQIKGLLARRDLIVRHFEEKLAAHGEAVVLYDMEPRLTGVPRPR